MRPLELTGWLVSFVPVMALLGILPVAVGIGASAVAGCILIAAQCG